MIHALILLAAAEGEATSKTLFYVLGGALVVWAVLVSAIGITRHASFPPNRGAAAAVLLISAVLMVGAMASAVITA